MGVQILSDFIVKHRGVFTVNTKDAFENIDQVEAIVFSSYDACTKPDPEDPQKRSFVAQVGYKASQSSWVMHILGTKYSPTSADNLESDSTLGSASMMAWN